MIEFKFALTLIFYPRQAFVALKTERSRTGYLGDIVVLISIVLVRIAYIYTTHFPLAVLQPRDSNLLLEIVRLIVPLLSWVVANSAVTSIFDGEVMPRQTLKASVYAICGLTSALGAIVLTSRLNAGESIAGMGYELDVIASVVIGGTSLMGGRGGVWGTLIGALLIGTINNGMNLLMISSYYQLVVKGAIIVAAVLLDRLREQ